VNSACLSNEMSMSSRLTAASKRDPVTNHGSLSPNAAWNVSKSCIPPSRKIGPTSCQIDRRGQTRPETGTQPRRDCLSLEIAGSQIFNTDQGVQFTSADFLAGLEAQAVRISMDGKGRYLDNIFIERLWRSLKYEEIFLKAYGSPAEARVGIGAWLSFYNDERPHQTHGYRTPREVFTGVTHAYVDNVSTLTH